MQFLGAKWPFGANLGPPAPRGSFEGVRRHCFKKRFGTFRVASWDLWAPSGARRGARVSKCIVNSNEIASDERGAYKKKL